MKNILIFFSIFFELALLSPVVRAANPLSLAIARLDGDFIEKGYALAEMRAVFSPDGKAAAGIPVFWEIVSVDNRSGALPSPEKKRMDGLRWEHPLPSEKRIETLPSVTDSTGAAKATLTDRIGERAVTVAVTAEHGGRKYKVEKTVVFGNGPLSLFAAPLPEPVTWLELYEICNGEPYPGNPAAWEVGRGFVGGGKMPSLEQLQSISMPSGHNNRPAALAAAVAAGWPVDKRYWNGRAVMKNRASHMDIRNGTHHGSGGNDVNAKEYGVCLR